MIITMHDHQAAIALVSRLRLRVITAQMVMRGNCFDGAHGHTIVSHDRSRYFVLSGDYSIVIHVTTRPGVCVECGRVEPCAHSRRT